MAPMMMKVGMLLFLALSIHAAARRKQGNACENRQNGEFTKVTANNYKETSAVTNEEELYDCSTTQTTKGVLRCLEGQWTKCRRVCGRPVSTDANAYLENKETSFAPGVKIRYSCAVGYALSGGNRHRRCLPKTFTWSPLTIKCERSSCGSAGEILNGEVIYTGVEFGHTATTVCAKGYLLVGKANRTCLSGGWDGRPAFCEAVQCTKPKTNTETLGPWKASYTYRQVLMFRCRQGTLVGQKAISCSENATWSAPPPVCKDVECPRPNVPHSSLSGSWRPPFRYRASMTFSCDPGYVLEGQSSVSCSLEGRWTPALPQCIYVECPRPNVPHSSLSGSWRPPFRYRASMTFSCDPGYVLEGQSSVSCSLEGRWTPALPQCISPREQGNACENRQDGEFTKVTANNYKETSAVTNEEELYDCSTTQTTSGVLRCLEGQWTKCARVCGRPVNTVANAYLEDKETSFVPGVEISYSCAVGYALSGGNRHRRCLPKTFTWSPLTIKCERSSCGSAGEILNGEVIYTGVEFGHRATTVCAKGYFLVGKANRTCLSVGWDGRPAFCEAVQCTKPKTNTETLGPWKASYAYSQVLIFRCRQGTLVGQKAISCSENATWSAPPPVCKDVECPRPNVPHSSLSGSWRPPFRYRASMTFSCDPGYVLEGQSSVSCSLEGRWTPALPQCIYVECPRPNVPYSSQSGSWRPPFGYRSSMTFSCNSGFVLVGQASVSCSLEGRWTPALPQCIWNGYGGNGYGNYGGYGYGGNRY
ncbi:complement receptor type 1-like isoform X2 [Gadus chalcogrammus]|uniref:complement receptor type 1-like isoform X2 n=1 Tax=Gadus chalcogrammus TaxID=1042646 RepID=UPI0024C33D9F|nr:complement receptor type 1-like isoform X2 [Gadus chalcogrammus]